MGPMSGHPPMWVHLVCLYTCRVGTLSAYPHCGPLMYPKWDRCSYIPRCGGAASVPAPLTPLRR
jgi:hypothetical protein